jgi:uncharacterized protein YukJ
MKIIITESQLDYLRRLPAVEERLDIVLNLVNPRSSLFDNFKDYLYYITGRTIMHLPTEITGEDNELVDKISNYIMNELSEKIKKIYISGKPGSIL